MTHNFSFPYAVSSPAKAARQHLAQASRSGLLHRALHAASAVDKCGCHSREPPWGSSLALALPCPSTGMFSARPLRFLGNAAGSVKCGAATERSEACP